MVTIQQDFSLNELNNLLIKYGDTNLSFNAQAITEDIRRLEKRLEEIQERKIPNKEVHKKNIGNIIAYLNRIIKKAGDKSIKINWSLNDNIVKSYPIEMKSIPEYGIYTTDYINLENNKMVYLDYAELADIIAFEMMYRDLGETNDTIEDKLSGIGILSISESSELTKYFTDSPYELSKLLRVASSPYLVPGENKMVDYFGRKTIDTDRYREIVSYSCRCAMAFIVEALMKKASSNGLKIRLCGVFDTGVCLIVPEKENVDIQKEVAEAVYIRTFGRKLEVKPKVQIF